MVKSLLIDELWQETNMNNPMEDPTAKLFNRLNQLREEERTIIMKITRLQVKLLREQLGDDLVKKVITRAKKIEGSAPKNKPPK
jgi:hypothetical protein